MSPILSLIGAGVAWGWGPRGEGTVGDRELWGESRHRGLSTVIKAMNRTTGVRTRTPNPLSFSTPAKGGDLVVVVGQPAGVRLQACLVLGPAVGRVNRGARGVECKDPQWMGDGWRVHEGPWSKSSLSSSHAPGRGGGC